MREVLLRRGVAFHVLLFLTGFTLIFLRRPDCVLNPQFWAEDGAVWWADAYNHGVLDSLLMPREAYLQTFSRTSGAIAQFMPFSAAPAFFNALAILVKLIPAHFMLSRRFDGLGLGLLERALLVAVYFLLPNTAEIHANLTNVQWHLAFLSCLILVAADSTRRAWKIFDVSFLTVGCLSGPCSVLLAPVAAVTWLVKRTRWLTVKAAIICSCAVVQTLCVLLLRESDRSTAVLGASLARFIRIAAHQLFLTPVLGSGIVNSVASTGTAYTLVMLLVVVLGGALLLRGVSAGPAPLKILVAYSLLLFAAMLVSPQVSLSQQQWPLLEHSGTGGRYFLIPMMGFFACLIWLAFAEPKPRWRFAARAALGLSLVGLSMDFRHAPFYRLPFGHEVARLERAAPGQQVRIAINPPGWEMVLTKRE